MCHIFFQVFLFVILPLALNIKLLSYNVSIILP